MQRPAVRRQAPLHRGLRHQRRPSSRAGRGRVAQHAAAAARSLGHQRTEGRPQRRTQLSILDGWWAEAYDGLNGFAIGNGETHTSQDLHDCARCRGAGAGPARRSDSALLRARPRRPAAALDRAHEARDPHARLAVQRGSHGDRLRAARLRAGGGRHQQRHAAILTDPSGDHSHCLRKAMIA